MSQPMPSLVLAFLLVGTAAAAQPLPPVRERIERRVTLPSSSEGRVLEVHLAPGAVTLVVFDMPLDKASVELEGRVSRFRLADVGERLLALEPSGEIGPEEKLGLRARLKDGTQAALVLTSHPTQVDGRVDVERPRSREALLAELAQKETQLSTLKAQCGTHGLAGAVLNGLLDASGVRVTLFRGAAPPDNKSGLQPEGGVGYRGKSWALVAVKLHNLPGQKAWAPGGARLYGEDGREVTVLAVHPAQALKPGEVALVVVETGTLPPEAGRAFRLELFDADGGRPLSIQGVKL